MFVSPKDEGNDDIDSLLAVYAACEGGDAFMDEQDGKLGYMEPCTGVKEPVTEECEELDVIDERTGLTGSDAFINPIIGEELRSGLFT